MRWSPLARKECRTIITSKGAWLLVPLIILWGFRPTYAGWGALHQNITVGYIQIGASFLLPLGTMLLGYQSLVNERTSGSIKFLLALPLTRTHVLLGKTIGRFVGVGAIALLSFLLLTIIGIVEHGVFSVLLYLGVVIATLILVADFIAIAVAISAVAKRTVTAATSIVGIFLILIEWQSIVRNLYSALTGVQISPYNPPADGPFFLLLRLTPDAAYNVLTNWLLGVGNSADLFHFVYMQIQPSSQVNVYVVDTTFQPGTVPWYLHPALSIVILLLWLLLPLSLARVLFNRGDTL